VARFSKEAMTMSVYHKVEQVKIENGVLSLRVDGQLIKKELRELSSILDRAGQNEITNYVVSSSGYGIYWPLIDEDISIDGLLGIEHSPPQWKKIA
jgi:hypothetical protein